MGGAGFGWTGGRALSDAWAKGALIFYDGARPHRWTELQWRHLTTRWRYGVALRTTQSRWGSDPGTSCSAVRLAAQWTDAHLTALNAQPENRPAAS